DHDLQRMRCPRAAVVRIDRDRFPSRFVEALPRRLEAFGREHVSVLEAAALRVGRRIERADHFAAPAVALGERRPNLFLGPRLVRRLSEELTELELLEEQKHHLAKIGLVAVDRLMGLATAMSSFCGYQVRP